MLLTVKLYKKENMVYFLKRYIMPLLLFTSLMASCQSARCIKRKCVIDRTRPPHINTGVSPRVVCKCLEYEEIEDETDYAYPDNDR